MKVHNNLSHIKRNFSTNKIKNKLFDTNKFIKDHKKKIIRIFDKQFLTYAMTYNTIYFCSKYREMSNVANFIRPLVIALNSSSKLFLKSNLDYLSKFYFKNWIKKKLFFNKFINLISFTNNFSLNNITRLINITNTKISNLNILKRNKEIMKKNKEKKEESKNNDKPLINGFLLVRSTRNNFFVTILDNNGHTLVSRTGGSGERTSSRQKSSVFSADSAMYEACFLAKQRGVDSLSIHIRSTFWLPQIKNSFDGLEASGLLVNELLYWPIVSFGGCRKKKPRRV